LRKNIAVLLSVISVLFIFTSIANAQQEAKDPKVSAQQVLDDAVQLMRQDIRSQRKQLVAANMPLTDTEATKFWPVYDRYIAEMTKLGDTRLALVKEYAQNYDTLTDPQADSLLKRALANDDAVTKLRQQWIPEFQKVISPKKSAMFMQIDRRIGMMLDLKLASEIPLVKPN
jgi:hypothetical protein